MVGEPVEQSKPVLVSISALEKEIYQRVNHERPKYGGEPLLLLQLNYKLSDIARNHSKDMARRNFFSHYSPEGKNSTDRANIVGYFSRKKYVTYYTERLAENIFKSLLYSSVTYYNGVSYYNWISQSDIASFVVSGWMSSPGHRQNILTKTYEKEGIGVAVCLERKEVYVTQNFC